MWRQVCCKGIFSTYLMTHYEIVQQKLTEAVSFESHLATKYKYAVVEGYRKYHNVFCFVCFNHSGISGTTFSKNNEKHVYILNLALSAFMHTFGKDM